MLRQVFQLLCVDPSLGRLDYDSLPDQALMEILIAGSRNPKKAGFQDANGNFKDVCEWNGVTCVDDRVTEITFCSVKFERAQFPFDYVPPLVEVLSITGCDLFGNLNLSVLPQNLEKLEVSSHSVCRPLCGSLDFMAFPRKLTHIAIDENSFSGSCALADLPDSVITFNAASNKFSGSISLNNLPAAMQFLHLRNNDLSGCIHIESLPHFMRQISLSNNSFSGEFRLKPQPLALQYVEMMGNNFSPTIRVCSEPGLMRFKLTGRWIQAVIDENGNRHPNEYMILYKNGMRFQREISSDEDDYIW